MEMGHFVLTVSHDVSRLCPEDVSLRLYAQSKDTLMDTLQMTVKPCVVCQDETCAQCHCQRGEMHLLCVKTRHALRVTVSKRRDALRVTPYCSIKRGVGRY